MAPLTLYLFFWNKPLTCFVLSFLSSFLSRSCERPEYLRPSPLSWKRQIPFSSAICLILALFSPQAAVSASSLPRFPHPRPPIPLFVFLLISLCPYSISSHLSAHPSEASSLPSHQMYPLPPFTRGNPQRFPGPNHWCQFRAAPRRTRCPICIPPPPPLPPPPPPPLHPTRHPRFPDILQKSELSRCGVTTWAAHF